MRKTLNLGIKIYKGTDFSVIIQVPNTDITDYSFEGCLKLSTDSTEDPVAEFSFVIRNQITFLGQVFWNMSNDTTLDIPTSIANSDGPCRLSTDYLYDIVMTDNLGARTRIIQGIAAVSPGVNADEEESP